MIIDTIENIDNRENTNISIDNVEYTNTPFSGDTDLQHKVPYRRYG